MENPKLFVERRKILHAMAGFGVAALGGCVTADPKTSSAAIVFMHGKTATPTFQPFANAASLLRSAGFAVSTPEMPWSRSRYLSGSLSEAFDQISSEVDRFRKAGFSKVIVGGHSIGGGIAVGYAAVRGAVDGLILFAPGHSPADSTWATIPSLIAARQMVREGREAEQASFADVNLGARLSVRISAGDYLTWMDPAGDAEPRNTAGRVPADVPVFVAFGNADQIRLRQLAQATFHSLPVSPRNRLEGVEGDHFTMLSAAMGPASDWLKETFPPPVKVAQI